MRVPTTNQVVPGASVNIVLKADQPTGRTVPGKIQDVLTRGNHPRGIKVRLTDGRVGRVQSMAASSSSAIVAEENAAGAGDFTFDTQDGRGDDGNTPNWGDNRGAGKGGRGGYGRPERARQQDAPVQQAVGLDAFIKQPARGKRGGQRGGGGSAASEEPTPSMAGGVVEPRADTTKIHKCPVCNEFEGDEAALTHHVNGHFAS